MFRSQYAGAETPTWVELTFAYGGKTYLVRRSPEYQRPAKKGGGMTTQRAEALLELPDGRLVTRAREVTAEITRIIGLEDPVPFHQIAYLNLCKSPKGSESPKTDSLWHGHPSRMDGYDIYLKDVKTAEAGFWNPDVQLELVRDPWKTGMYVGLAYILLALAGMLIQRLFCHREQEDGKES